MDFLKLLSPTAKTAAICLLVALFNKFDCDLSYFDGSRHSSSRTMTQYYYYIYETSSRLRIDVEPHCSYEYVIV